MCCLFDSLFVVRQFLFGYHLLRLSLTHMLRLHEPACQRKHKHLMRARARILSHVCYSPENFGVSGACSGHRAVLAGCQPRHSAVDLFDPTFLEREHTLFLCHGTNVRNGLVSASKMQCNERPESWEPEPK